MKNTNLILTAVTVAALLSACGGGGGGTATAPVVTTAPVASAPFSSVYVPLQTTVPAPPYAAGSRELAEFNTLNEQRSKCGFGLLASNESLRLAAQDHASYMTEYDARLSAAGISIHNQSVQFPNGFTGATVFDRVKFRGYGGNLVSEGIGGSLKSTNTSRHLLSLPYHAGTMLSGFTDIGISVGVAVVFDYGSQSKFQRKDSSILTYPCAGVTGTKISLDNETPSPYLPRNLVANPIGQPVYFFADESAQVPAGKKSLIEVTDLVVTEDVSGVLIVMLPVQNKDNDPVSIGSGFAYAAPDKPLKNLTKYRVRATVKSNGVTTQVDYTFTTG